MTIGSFRLNTLSAVAGTAVSSSNIRVTNSTYSNGGATLSSGGGKFGNALNWTNANAGGGVTFGTTSAGQIQWKGTQALTVEFWVYVSATPNAAWPIIASKNSSDVNIVYNSSQSVYKIMTGTGTTLVNIDTSTTWTPAVWHHIVFQQSGSSTWSMWFDGVAQVTNSTSIAGTANGFDLSGSTTSSGSLRFDEMMITTTARYKPGTSFTPPTAPYVNTTNTVGLFHFESTSQTDDTSGATVVAPILSSSSANRIFNFTKSNGQVWEVHEWNTAGTKSTPYVVDNGGTSGSWDSGVVLIGGGGGGGGAISGAGGGGGGGRLNVQYPLIFGASTIVVGSAGTAGATTSATRGGGGGPTTWNGYDAAGGAGGANNTTGGTVMADGTSQAYASGGGGTNSTSSPAGGASSASGNLGQAAFGSSTSTLRSGGGGAGGNGFATAGVAGVGGKGGAGFSMTANTYGDESTTTYYGAGGGGGGSTAGAGGGSGQGTGGSGGSGATNGAGNAGITYGSGGGGAFSSASSAVGGAGKVGLFRIFYRIQ